MSESEDSSSTDEEDNRSTLGVLSSKQSSKGNYAKEACQKMPNFSTSQSHTSRPPIDVKSGQLPLELGDPHKLHL